MINEPEEPEELFWVKLYLIFYFLNLWQDKVRYMPIREERKRRRLSDGA